MGSPAPDDLDRALLAHFAQGMDAPLGDAEFDALALAVFAYQYDALPAYHDYCQRRGALPQRVRHCSEIPAVPAQAFKDVRLWCDDDGVTPPAAVFRTSGTTRGGGATARPGEHYMSATGLALYDASLTPTFRAFVLPELAAPGAGAAAARSALALLVLGPPPAAAPHSSLWHMVDVAGRALFTAPARWFMTGAGGLDADGLLAALTGAEREKKGVCLVTTDLALDRFLDALALRGARVALPGGSRLVRTGGAKGRRRALGPAALVTRAVAALGVPAASCVTEYGMTELASQFYAQGADFLTGPPWLRATVVDPRSLEPLPPGQPGLLRMCDLANRGSALVVLTEDFGVAATDEELAGAWAGAPPTRGARPFRLLGRAAESEPRGCSLDAEEVPA